MNAIIRRQSSKLGSAATTFSTSKHPTRSKLSEPRQQGSSSHLPVLTTAQHNAAQFSRLQADRLRLMPFNRSLTQPPSHYDVLGVHPAAKAAVIKSAYYNLAKQFHPDTRTHGSAETRRKFVQLTAAYETLADPAKRAAYDKSALAPRNHGLMGRNPERVDTFTQQQHRSASSGASQAELQLDVTFSEAVCGADKTVSVSHTAPCLACRSAAGGNASTRRLSQSVQQSVPCPTCKGTGRHDNPNGACALRSGTSPASKDCVCKTCLGTRFKVRTVCAECADRGTITTTEAVAVSVPAGSTEATVLTVQHPHTGRQMHVQLCIRNSEQFRRDGYDVHTVVRIPFTLAILGGPLAVPGVYGGEVHTRLPPGTQADTQIRLSGKGIRKESGGGGQLNQSACYGDHILTLKIAIPQHLNERQRTLLASFVTAEAAAPKPSPTTRQSVYEPVSAATPSAIEVNSNGSVSSSDLSAASGANKASAASQSTSALLATATEAKRRNWSTRLSATAKYLMVGT